MAKYYKFYYDAGYCGTEREKIIKYDDDVSEEQVFSDFNIWYENQRNDSGDFKEISEEKAEELGIDIDLLINKEYFQ